MNTMIEELKAIPGVVGGFVMHTSEGIRDKNLPAFFKEERLLEIGKRLQKIWSASRMNFPDTVEVSLFYGESVLIIRQVEEQHFLVLVCDPSVNSSMLSMSVNLAMEELAQRPQGGTAAKPPPKTKSSSISATPDQIRKGPLADLIEKTEGALAQVMGPMASLIFEDALKEWCGSGNASAEGVRDLLEILGREIDDPQKNESFMTLVRPYLS